MPTHVPHSREGEVAVHARLAEVSLVLAVFLITHLGVAKDVPMLDLFRAELALLRLM